MFDEVIILLTNEDRKIHSDSKFSR